MSRPNIKINWEEFDKLCGLCCTQTEIASWFNCSVDTIDRACKREKKQAFAEYFAKKMQVGNISLRRRQWQAAMEGNITMLIWLGKQRLGQRQEVPTNIIVNNMPGSNEGQHLEEVRAILRERDDALPKEPLTFMPATNGLLTR